MSPCLRKLAFYFSIAPFLAITPSHAGAEELLDYVVWSGTIEFGDPPEQIAIESSASGRVGVHSDRVEFLRSTSKIPAHIGVNFGIRFFLPGERSEPARFDVIWRLPKPGIPGPSGERQTESGYNAGGHCRTENPCSAAYGLDSEEELLLGEWTVEIVLDGKVVIRKSFWLVRGE